MLRPALLAAAILSAAAPATAQDASLVRQGELLARALCADCHAIDQRVRSDAPAPPFAAIGATPSTTALSLRVFLRSPHPTMPNLILSDPQIEALTALILQRGGR